MNTGEGVQDPVGSLGVQDPWSTPFYPEKAQDPSQTTEVHDVVPKTLALCVLSHPSPITQWGGPHPLPAWPL